MSKNYKIAVVLLLSFSLLLLIAKIIFKPLFQDEGVFLTIGKGIAHGLLPYRDFFDHKPPAIYFLFALAKNLPITKIMLIIANFLTILLSAKLAKKLNADPLLAALFTSTLFIFFEGNRLIAEPFVALALVASIWFLVSNSKSSAVNALLAGVLAGLAILFKQTAVASVLIIFIYACVNERKTLHWFFLGLVLPSALTGLYLWENSVLYEAANQIFTLNFTSYPRESFSIIVRGLWQPFVFSLPIWVFSIYSVIKLKNNMLIIAMALFPIPFFFVRHYPHYWLQILPFIAILASANFPMALSLRDRLKRPKQSFANVCRALQKPNGSQRQLYIYLVIFYLGFFLYFPIKQFIVDFSVLNEEKAATRFISAQPEINMLAENQFSGFYFLTDKKPINKYLYITEINDWSEESEQKTLDDLRSNPDTIILWPSDPNFAYAKKLQDYIFENYKPIKKYPGLGLDILNAKR